MENNMMTKLLTMTLACAMATKAYKKPSSRAVCVIISKRMRSFHAAAPGSRPGERGGEFDWISPWWW